MDEDKEISRLRALLKKKRKSLQGDPVGVLDTEEVEPEEKRETLDDDGPEDDDCEEEEEDRKEECSRSVTHGYHLVKGKMGHGMEDYIVAEHRKINGHDLRLYAIFDGHAGRDVADYLQSHLFDNILNEPGFWKNPKRAIKRAYKATDSEILEKVVGSRGGSTAVTAVLVDEKKLVVANVGDSRAILCKKDVVEPITVDHDPEKKQERDLVKSKGGFVSKGPGNVARVDGQLAMTRAFGDERLKDHITAEPDVRLEVIDNNTEFIILASDGLWKVMSNEEAYDYIKGMTNPTDASKRLIKEALSRQSRDDISCIVVSFDTD